MKGALTMAAPQFCIRTRAYALYTGASHQVARDAVASLAPHAPLIPAATHHAQVLLESEVFSLILDTQRDFFEYPLGIWYVQPTPEGLRLHLESNASLDSLLGALLPKGAPRHRGRAEIYGLNGVRICERTQNGIELRRLGQPTSIKLTGPSRKAFQKAEAALAEGIQEGGGEACWLAGDTWTASERQWDNDRQPLTYESGWRDAAWLPSGLLRRLGLLHTVAIPQVVTGHMARIGRWWILQLEHGSDTGLRQARLVEALTDPVHGLPLELRGHRDMAPDGSVGLVLLKSPDRTATLELRYGRIDYRIRDKDAKVFATIRQRIGKLTGEAPLPAMPVDYVSP